MLDRSRHICPILVGRDELLQLADRRLASARSGRGQFLLFAGEAGMGKTRLAGAIRRRAEAAGFGVAVGAAFPGDVELVGSVLLDLGRYLARAPDGPRAGLGRSLVDRLEAAVATAAASDGDGHRRRRLAVLDLADQLAELAADGPAALVLEDLHWADDLTLEVLGQLARRIPDSALLVMGTYRSDELYPRVPMRAWRVRLLNQRLAEEVRVSRLTLDQIGTMAMATLGTALPMPTRFLEELHARSDGIPLHVEEFLDAMVSGGGSSAIPVPETLAQAVLARAAPLGSLAREVLEAAATVGRSFDLDLLVAVAGREPGEVAAALDELGERYFIVPGARPGGFDFRHALIRDAIEEAIPEPRRRALHLRVAEAGAATRPPLDAAVLSAHREMGGDLAGAHRLALEAARRAAATSSHREAADLYRRTIRTADPDLDPAERAHLLAEYAAEAAAADDNEAAAQAYETARSLLRAAGQEAAAAALVAPLVACRHLLGDALEARVAMLESGLKELDASPTPSVAVRATIEAGLAAAYMLDRRLEASIDHGELALRLSREADDRGVELNTAATLGSVLVFSGRMDEGWALLEDAVRRARGAGLEAEAARAYRMIGSCASVLVEYDRAERWLAEGVDYAERVELWNDRHYMAAHSAHVAWATGDWRRSKSLAERALADGRGGITTRITCLHALGYVALGSGDRAAAEANLAEARQLGERMAELQRLSPALWGLAETAVLAGEHERAVELCRAGLDASERVRDAAYLFPFLVTGTRAYLGRGDPLAAGRWVERVERLLRARSIPGTLPAIDHAHGLLLLSSGRTGQARDRLAAALTAWRTRRRIWEAMAAALDLADGELRANRPVQAARLARSARDEAAAIGAEPLVRRADELLGAVGRRSARRPADEPWAPLTMREFEVARLVAEGLTNGEIAAELSVSRKTVAAHLEHILTRLGMRRRAEVAAWVAAIVQGTPLAQVAPRPAPGGRASASVRGDALGRDRADEGART